MTMTKEQLLGWAVQNVKMWPAPTDKDVYCPQGAAWGRYNAVLGALNEHGEIHGMVFRGEWEAGRLACCTHGEREDDDLTWLAHDLHEWSNVDGDLLPVYVFRDGRRSLSDKAKTKWVIVNGEVCPETPLIHHVSSFGKAQWLTRRAELQNKQAYQSHKA